MNHHDLKAEALVTKKSLIKRKTTKPPMCNRMTLSVDHLIDHCDKILFLCDELEKKENEK